VASWSEINRIRGDADESRLIASRILADSSQLSSWELDFLENIGRWKQEELSLRQAEKLAQIRDEATFVSSWDGINIRYLIRACYEARLDLAEEDEEWISQLRAADASAVRRRQLARLLRCARSLQLID
jgi:hypothetical protein